MIKKLAAAGGLATLSSLALAGGPLDYNYFELGAAYVDVDSGADSSTLIGAEYNNRLESNLFYELSLSNSSGDEADILAASGGLGYAFNLSESIELAPSISANFARAKVNDNSVTNTTLGAAIEGTLTLGENLFLELDYSTSLDSDVDLHLIYLGLQGGASGGMRWEAGISTEIESEVNQLGGRILFPHGETDGEWFVGGAFADYNGADGFGVLGGYRWNL